MQNVQIFLLLYVVSIGIMYVVYNKGGKGGGNSPMAPGDFYRVIGSKRIYIPFGSSLIITIILYILLSLAKSRII